MKLKLRETFEFVGYPCEYVVRKGEPQQNAFAKFLFPFYAAAFPHGGEAGKECGSRLEVHEYLIAQGSESPWEECE